MLQILTKIFLPSVYLTIIWLNKRNKKHLHKIFTILLAYMPTINREHVYLYWPMCNLKFIYNFSIYKYKENT